MRPVTKPAPGVNYVPPLTITFADGNIALMNMFFGTNQPQLVDCLELVLRKVKGLGPPPNTGTQQDMDAAISAIQTRVTGIYKTASAPLTAFLGDFCSYCETPLLGLLEVEHTVPKAPYPTFATDWLNFLLSCGPCNNKKSDNPDRNTVEGWMGNPANPTEQDYYDSIRTNHYAWPDLKSKTFEMMPIGFWYESAPNNWQQLTDPEASNLNTVLVSYNILTQVVTGTIDDGNPILANYPVHVEVNINNNIQPARSTEMIQLLGLNDLGTPNTTYDRRVMNRTRAWFFCIQFIKSLENVQNDAEFNLLWPAVLMMSRTTGFYSLWVTLMGNFDAPNTTPPPARVSMATRFVDDTDTDNYFPSTNTTDLP